MNKHIEQLMKEREPVHPKCRGEEFSNEEKALVASKICEKIEPLEFVDDEGQRVSSSTDGACRCKAYVSPKYWWARGRCPLATHFRSAEMEADNKKRVGQQKQKKKH